MFVQCTSPDVTKSCICCDGSTGFDYACVSDFAVLDIFTVFADHLTLCLFIDYELASCFLICLPESAFISLFLLQMHCAAARLWQKYNERSRFRGLLECAFQSGTSYGRATATIKWEMPRVISLVKLSPRSLSPILHRRHPQTPVTHMSSLISLPDSLTSSQGRLCNAGFLLQCSLYFSA